MFDLVTIIIPFYNGSIFELKRAIQSVMNQTYKELEVIVCDDGSADYYAVQLEQLKADNVKIVHNTRRQGISCARNLAASIAKGKWLVWLDSDDTLDNLCIERMIANSTKHVLVVGQCLVHEANSVEMREPSLYFNLYKKYQNTYFDPFVSNVVSVQPQMILKSVFDKIGGFDETFLYAEMTDFFLRCLLVIHSDEICFISDAIYNYYRLRNSSMSSNRKTLFKYRLLALKRYAQYKKLPIDNIIYLGRSENTKMQTYLCVKDNKILWPNYISIINSRIFLLSD
ncbi:glycosyltransferase family 2 protein [Sporofaciens sp. JLR.KK001]|uniref:glycosyltransferase family 2 protein n=1 Tax=Sporofaciens sp. JLR.KK001 TaxID=3112621 RepID=UPI002FF15D61